MLVFLFVTIFILNILAYRWRINFDGVIDLISNRGNAAIKLFGFDVFKMELYFEHSEDGTNSLIIKHGKKRTEIHLNADKKDEKSILRIMNYPAFENLSIPELTFSVSMGKKDDAFLTTLTLGSIRLASYSLLSFLKTRFDSKITESFIPEYNNDKFFASANGIFSISFADIIISYVLSKIHKSQIFETSN